MATPNFTFIMMGPEAVGKTTLLATMYKKLINMKGYDQFEVSPGGDTGVDLERAYQKLASIIEQPTSKGLEPLLEGTRGIIEHQFEIAFKDKKELDIVFADIAGGLINAKENAPDFTTFQDRLNRAIVIINVIDGAALVEGSDLFSDKINKPIRIRDLLIPAFRDEQKHLVLFVITKCEAWLKSREGANKLRKAFQERYKAVINLVQERPNAVGVLIPVKTLGCVEFSQMEGKGDDERTIFRRRVNLEFSPEFTDQPLRYALGFALSQRMENRGLWEKLSWSVTNKNKLFRKSLDKFISERYTNFTKYGNYSLLD